MIFSFLGGGTIRYFSAFSGIGGFDLGIDTNPEYVEMSYGRVKPYMEQRKLAGGSP